MSRKLSKKKIRTLIESIILNSYKSHNKFIYQESLNPDEKRKAKVYVKKLQKMISGAKTYESTKADRIINILVDAANKIDGVVIDKESKEEARKKMVLGTSVGSDSKDYAGYIDVLKDFSKGLRSSKAEKTADYVLDVYIELLEESAEKEDAARPEPKPEEKRDGQGKKKKSKYKKAPTLKQVASRQKTLTTYHIDKSPTSVVIIVQKLLNIYAKGGLISKGVGKPDGAFGPKTENALKLLLMNRKFSEFLNNVYESSEFKDAPKTDFLQDASKPVKVDSVLLFAMAAFSKTSAVKGGNDITEYADNVLERFQMYSKTPKERFEKDLDDMAASLGDDIAKKMNESYGESRGTLYRKRYRRY